jgi:transcriptional regulator with PAS, ATPase and Fis domain
MNFSNVFDMLNLGVVILDQEYRIVYWNNWMGMHSEIPAEEVVGRDIFEAFPEIDTPVVRRSFSPSSRSEASNSFSQTSRLSLPIRTFSSFDTNYEFMQQSCTFSPLRKGWVRR